MTGLRPVAQKIPKGTSQSFFVLLSMGALGTAAAAAAAASPSYCGSSSVPFPSVHLLCVSAILMYCWPGGREGTTAVRCSGGSE